MADIQPDAGAAAQVRQGVVEAWDSATGNNTIRAAGGVLANVPSLTAESASLKTNDVVALLSAGDRWFVLGKVTTPGDPGTVPTWNADITALTGQVDTIQTVTIPAVQNDVTIVQGDVVELNTVTIPAVQADVTTAQTTANNASSAAATAASAAAAAQDAATALDTRLDAAESDVAAAQSDITTLTGTTLPALQTQVNGILPITETKISDDAITTPKIAAGAITATEIAASAVTTSALAANAVTAAKITAGTITATELAAGAVTAAKIAATAIDGKTITGALIRTAASGQRVEIDSATWQRIKFYSGAAGETAPGIVRSDNLSGFGILELESPALADGRSASLTLQSVPGGGVQATLTADNTTLSAGDWARLQAGSHIFELDDTGALTLDGNTVLAAGATGNVPRPVTVSDPTDLTGQTNTTFAAGTPACGLAFVAPPSGMVYVTVSGRIQSETASNNSYLAYEVRTGAVVGSGTLATNGAPSDTNALVVGGNATGLTFARVAGSKRALLTGLTPGSSYNVRTMHRSQNAGGVTTIFDRELLVEPVL